MLKAKNQGLAIVETILVIAISAALFVVVIGVFTTRQRTQYDDAARQVMAEIAKVRNEAQQGEGPATAALINNQSGKELFGKAIVFNTDFSGLATSISIKNLVVDSSGNVSEFSDRQVQLFAGMNFLVSSGQSAPSYCLNNLTTCIKSRGSFTYLGSNLKATNGNLVLVFLNRSGAGYALGENEYIKKSNYTVEQQLDLRLALAVIGQGISSEEKMNKGRAQYYVNINLPIPNSQSLEVVK